jgi:hypothetical protein
VVTTIAFLLYAFVTIWPWPLPPILFFPSVLLLAAVGTMIMLAPLMLTRIRNRPAWKDPLRASILATWIIAYIAMPTEGFYIKLNEAALHGQPVDLVFGNLHYFGVFAIAMVTLAFLAVDFFVDNDGVRKGISAAGILVTIFALITGYIYAFFNPGVLNSSGKLAGTTTWGLVFSVGLFLISPVVIAAMRAVLRSGGDKSKLLAD